MTATPPLTSEPVVIIGAPRSGTNILRDVLTSIDGLDTWPCDEINYIWRHGNVRVPSDELTEAQATRGVSSYIRRQFNSLTRSTGAARIVEKTCANSLRVPFVARVLPEAKFIYIERNGIDAAASARLRWQASLEVKYLAQKARYVPTTDLPYYASRYFLNRLQKLRSSEGRLASWGPRFSGLQEALQTRSLLEVCALQWQRCVELSRRDLAALQDQDVFRLRYESFVTQPVEVLSDIIRFLDHPADEAAIAAAAKPVRVDSLSRARQRLSEQELAAIDDLIGGTLSAHD